MKRVTIYLRSVEHIDDKGSMTHHLAMFDSNRNGSIDNLTTEVRSGETIIWKLDSCSGIRDIARIYPKDKASKEIFKTDARKRWFCKEYTHRFSTKTKIAIEWNYSIDYFPLNSTKITIDPCIRVLPPPDRP